MSPASFELAYQPPTDLEGTTCQVRRVSDLQDYYQDKTAVGDLLAAGDPEIYQFWSVEYAGGGAGLSYGVTTIQPGKVGREFYMTKGHYHAGPGDEIYLALSGHGSVLLRNQSGQVKTYVLKPGKMVYIDEGWGHRTVNDGTEPLMFVSIWAPGIEHDYERVLREGYPTLAESSPGGASGAGDL
jgi:glucose-6-phosphate isomerase